MISLSLFIHLFIYLFLFFLWFSKKHSFSARKNNVLPSVPQETGKAFNYGSVNSKRAHPPTPWCICRAFAVGNGQKTCAGGGEFVKTRSGERRFFFNISLKNMPN